MKKDSVLFIANYLKAKGGISNQIDILVSRLKESNIDVQIFSTKGSFFYRISVIFRLIIVARKFSVLHVHGCSFKGFLPILYGVVIGKLLMKRIIITYHGGNAESFLNKYGSLIRWVLNVSDCTTVPSPFLSDIFLRNRIACCTVPNIIEPKAKRMKVRKIGHNLLSTRTLEHVYNIESTIRAFKIIKQVYPDTTLTLIGSGKCKKRLEELVQNENLTGITFTGLIPNEEIWQYLVSSDVYLNSSLVDNMPLSIMETFFVGLPVVSTNVGGIPYLIDNGANGILVNPNDHEQMANQVLNLFQNRDLYDKIALNSFQSSNKFTWEKVERPWQEVYFNKYAS